MWKLVIEDDEGKRTVVPLTRDDYAVGRKEGNTIRLTERNVSRDHAKIRKKNGDGKIAYVLDDLTSYNGVFINGIRVAQTHELVHGDLIQIGDYRILLQDDAVVEPTPTIPIITDAKTTIPSGAMRGSLLLERPNRLVMLAGPTPGVEFPLDRERLTVGRAEDATISVNHNSVSRLHCEIHALGEGRFEIVDKGSSNGVRVNAAELRRGIIEAGDVIELGDVKLKFVGAGQVFLPGVNDSQQLSAIGNRSSGSGRKGGSVIPYALLGALLTALLVFGWAWKRQQNQGMQTGSASAVPEADRDQAILQAAQTICDNGDCEKAHQKLHADLAETTPLRSSDTYRTIEVRWAEAMMKRADATNDVAKKRALLQEVASAQTVEAEHRAAAVNKIQELEPTPAPPPTTATAIASSTTDTNTAPPSPAPAPPPSSTHEHHHLATPGDQQAAVPVVSTPKPVPTQSGSTLDRAKDLMITDPKAAKALLTKDVYGGRASTEEIRTLRLLCHDTLNDQVCVSACDELLKK